MHVLCCFFSSLTGEWLHVDAEPHLQLAGGDDVLGEQLDVRVVKLLRLAGSDDVRGQ